MRVHKIYFNKFGHAHIIWNTFQRSSSFRLTTTSILILIPSNHQYNFSRILFSIFSCKLINQYIKFSYLIWWCFIMDSIYSAGVLIWPKKKRKKQKGKYITEELSLSITLTLSISLKKTLFHNSRYLFLIEKI